MTPEERLTLARTPLGYYLALRRDGYKPRTAYLCVLMRYATFEQYCARLTKLSQRHHLRERPGWK